MTPLNIATYEALEDLALEDLVLDSLSGSFFAVAHVSGQLYVGVPPTNFREGAL